MLKKILVLGSINMDFAIRVTKLPQVGETIMGKSVHVNAGGKGANQAYAAGKLGGCVSMLGAVGNDEYGEKMLRNLAAANVDISGIKTAERMPTGQAFVMIYDSGDNSIIVNQGANASVSKEMIDANMKYIDECDYLLMQMEIPFETLEYAKNLAVSKGKKIILDPAPAPMDVSDVFWNDITILKPNETELEIISGKKLHTQKEYIEAARELIGKGVETVILTMGKKGCILVDSEKVQSYPAYKTNCIDTTAAGDAFAAALAVAVCEEKSYEEAINFAQKVSSVVVSVRGAQTSVPWRKDVDNLDIVPEKGEQETLQKGKGTENEQF